jgi:glycosyltransferase involved in cell wall biosynthesis
MKILLAIPLSPYTGYGRDGIGLARALMRWGADVYLEPETVHTPLPEDVAQLLTKSPEGHFDLYICHLSPSYLYCPPGRKKNVDVTVGWTMWEASNFGNLVGRSSLKKNLRYFDALIGYDENSTNCLRDYAYKHQALLTVQGGYDPEDWPVAEKRDWDSDRFGFAMVGVLTERKDPFVAIQAFQELKNDPDIEFEGAELHLKTSVRTLHPAMEEVIPKLRVHYAVWPDEVLYKFYETQHVLLAPSRGEGKNMPALEMQSTGGTVIATNWGGHQQWLNPAYNYALDYQMAPVDVEHPNTFNARASVEHMKELMLHCYQNRAEVKRKGELASRLIPQSCSWDAVVERLFLRLKGSVDGGDKLWDKALMCRQDRDDD